MFKFSIGDHVVNKGMLQAALDEMVGSKNFVRLDRMSILERISVECIGGTQLFYACERWDGACGRYAEGSLTPDGEACRQWIDGLKAQLDRLEPPKADHV